MCAIIAEMGMKIDVTTFIQSDRVVTIGVVQTSCYA